MSARDRRLEGAGLGRREHRGVLDRFGRDAEAVKESEEIAGRGKRYRKFSGVAHPAPGPANDKAAVSPTFAIGTTLCSVLSAASRKRRMLRAACRMRCSFSTSAMRTYSSRARRSRCLARRPRPPSRPAAWRIPGCPVARNLQGSGPRRTSRRSGGNAQPAPGETCPPSRRGGACRSRASPRCSRPAVIAAVAATWTGVKAP